MLKLNLGSGDVRFPGFTNVDLYDKTADIKADLKKLPFENESIDEIMCIQVIEHIPYQESVAVFEEMYRVMKSGTIAKIETPDIDVVCMNILREGLTDKWIYNLVGEYYRPWDKDRYDDWYMNAASIHRNPWNYKRLKEVTEPIGFTIERKHWAESQYPCEENMYVILRKN